ncbi:MAG TPA: TIR domain-containing protein [Sedimentisphaerales bacterium]|nr:TIR domain-containing protein [Sedimentisphaerales bacterium]
MEELKYFFSYSRKDSEFVLKLAKDLRAASVNLWLDQLDVVGGQHWDSTVEEALRGSKGMIAVLSPESVASENVMDEVSYALDEGKLVVPVLIRSCNIPLRLRRVQYIDFTADYDSGFSQLMRALGIEQPAQPVEPADAQKPIVQDSTAPLEAKPTEPPVQEKQAAQDVQEPSSPEIIESVPGTPDDSKPTGVETEKAPRMGQKTKVLASICIVTLIAIISILVFLKNLQPKTYSLTANFVPNSVVTPPGFYIHKGCEPFKDKEEIINRGPITLVRVCHSDYIYGLQLQYGTQAGSFFGLETRDHGLQVTEWSVPEGERIVRVEGEIAKYGNDFLYVSRLRFITDKKSPWEWYDGNPGKRFVADANGLPLRTISGWANPRQHSSLKRAITSMTFHFGN